MNKVALFALSAAPFLAAGMGVVAAKVIPFWPFRLTEEGYAPGDAGSSCESVDAELDGIAATFTKEVDGVLDPWRIDIYGDAEDCRSFDVFNLLGRAQCNVRAPATVVYRNESVGDQEFLISTIGEHRVRASRHGLSCRQMN